MKTTTLRCLTGTIGAIASVALGIADSRAQGITTTYPSQDVHFVCGFAPGSGPDIITRFMADKMRPLLKRTIIVENKVGAVGNIATEYVAKAKPDGHTVYITGGNSLAASMFLFKNPSVDVGKELEVVATLSKQPTLLVVGPNSSYKTLAELTAAIKLKGDKASYGTAFPTARVLGALYRNSADTKAVEVQYRTSADWINDLASGALDFAFIDSVSGISRAKQGSFRVLAVTTGERPQALPEYPSMKEFWLPHRRAELVGRLRACRHSEGGDRATECCVLGGRQRRGRAEVQPSTGGRFLGDNIRICAQVLFQRNQRLGRLYPHR